MVEKSFNSDEALSLNIKDEVCDYFGTPRESRDNDDIFNDSHQIGF